MSPNGSLSENLYKSCETIPISYMFCISLMIVLFHKMRNGDSFVYHTPRNGNSAVYLTPQNGDSMVYLTPKS